MQAPDKERRNKIDGNNFEGTGAEMRNQLLDENTCGHSSLTMTKLNLKLQQAEFNAAKAKREYLMAEVAVQAAWIRYNELQVEDYSLSGQSIANQESWLLGHEKESAHFAHESNNFSFPVCYHGQTSSAAVIPENENCSSMHRAPENVGIVSSWRACPHKPAVSVVKKRKYKKRECVDGMPRRPLTPYNFFFSIEREKILRVIPKDGVEGHDVDTRVKAVLCLLGPDLLNEDEKGFEKELAKKLLAEQCLPLDLNEAKKRKHRKTHGKLGFVEMSKIIGKKWKALPHQEADWYRKLSKQDAERHAKAMVAFKRGEPWENFGPQLEKN